MHNKQQWQWIYLCLVVLLMLTSCITFHPPEDRQRSEQRNPSLSTSGSTQSEPTRRKTSTNTESQKVLISNRIHAISVNGQDVWIATDKGISQLSRATNRWEHHTKKDGLAGDNVHAVLSETGIPAVWFGTDDGVSQYNTASGVWQTFRSKDGLVGDSVFSLVQDDSHLWVGSDGGLNRYDTELESWAARTKDDGLNPGRVEAIAVANEYVWVGMRAQTVVQGRYNKTEGGGVNRYDRNTDSWTRLSTNEGLVHDQIATIAVSDDLVYFGTQGGGISVYSNTDQAFVKTYTKNDLLVSDDIRAIALDGNSLWIGTANGGVQRYIDAVDTWVTYTTQDGLASNHIVDIAVYGDEVWFATYNSGVSMMNKVTHTWTTYQRIETLPGDDVRQIVSDTSSGLWVATAEGLARYDTGSQQWTQYGKHRGLPTHQMLAVAVFQETNPEPRPHVWVGTTRGLAEMDAHDEEQQFHLVSEGLENTFITSLLVTDTHLWVGTQRGVFYKEWRSKEQPFHQVLPLGNVSVNALALSGEHLWVGSNMGVQRYSIIHDTASPIQLDHPLAHVNALLTVPEGMWIGTQEGAVFCNGQGHQQKQLTTADGLPADSVRAFAYDVARRYVWIGTSAGLAQYMLGADQCSNKAMEDAITHNIRSIQVVGQTLWLGTASGVVVWDILNRSSQPHRTPATRQFLLQQGISHIEFDGDFVWLSNWSGSRNGAILRYSRKLDTWECFTREALLKDTRARSMTEVRQVVVVEDAVWFATDYGVLRYDKARDSWEHFTVQDGLASNSIQRIAVGENVVWVSFGEGHKVSVFSEVTQDWETTQLSRIDYQRDRVYAMATDGNDAWLGLSTSALRRMSPQGQEDFFKTEEGVPRSNVRWICRDENTLWFANWQGSGQGAVSRYDKHTDQWTDYSGSDVLESDQVDRLCLGERYVWVLYRSWRDSGVTGYDKQRQTWTAIKPRGDSWRSSVTDIREDGDYLWMATQGDGVKRFHMASGTWTSFDSNTGLLHNWVNEQALKVDTRYVWIGTPRGLSRYDKHRESWTSYTKRPSLAGRRVHTLTVDDRYVWCGTSEGVSRYDKRDGRWRNFRKTGGYQRLYTARGSFSWWEPETEDSLIDNTVKTLAVGERYLWVGTQAGACRYDKVTDRWTRFTRRNGLPGEDISSAIVDGHDLWLGTSNGVARFPQMSDDPNAWVSFRSGLDIRPGEVSKEFSATLVSDDVWTLASDQESIWVGTMRGVSRYDKRKDLWVTLTTEDGLPTNAISSILIDGDIVWFGSDRGVAFLNRKSREWMHFTTEDGLASNRITCISSDTQSIWFGTFDAGLMRYDKQTHQWFTYNSAEGLAHNGVLSVCVDDDAVWVGTQRGLSRFDSASGSWTTFTEYQDSEDLAVP